MTESYPRLPVAEPARRFLPILLLLFVGSGCSALIYEIVWFQLLQLAIGSTAVSLGVLLGTFMGGMCLGSLLLPRLVSARRHPLKVYAAIEAGIGVVALLVLAGIQWATDFYTLFGGQGFSAIMLRGVLAAICLLPPTVLMGATLPTIARWVETSRDGVSWLGFFYGGNIAGAVVGSLAAGFYLLPNYDMHVATYVAAGINFTLALLAYGLAERSPHTTGLGDKDAAPRAPGSVAVYVAIGLSGLTALGAEVIWLRLMSLMLGATVYAFSIIVSVFLVGLGIGSSVGSALARGVKEPRLALGVCQALLVAGIGWTAFMISYSLPFWPVDPRMTYPPWGPWYTFQFDLACTFWAILPATLLWGASFPLALAAVAGRGQDGGRLVGGVYAANTLGAIIGALDFSLYGLPALGTQGAQRLLMVVAAFSALVTLGPLLKTASAPGLPRRSPVGLALFLLCALTATGALAWTVAPPFWGMVAYGRFSASSAQYLAPDMIHSEDQVVRDDSGNLYCEYVGEGMNVSVAVTFSSDGFRRFHGAGKVQASNMPQDMRLQRLLGHISVLAHPDPDKVKSVLVVACGAGVTAGSFIPYKNVEHITIVDIEPLVPTHVTPLFAKENYGVVGSFDGHGALVPGDPRVTVVYDDGRHFIRTTKEKFDVITSDPIDPWVKGCAAMNTVEYYTMCKEHLNPGGVMSLWIPFYESNLATAKCVLGTFFSVFPDGVLWSNDIRGEGYDAVLFGWANPTQINVDQVQAFLDDPRHAAVKQSLADVDMNSAVDLFQTYAGDARRLQPWLADAEINYDRNLRLQYLAGLWLNSYMGADILSGPQDSILKYYKFPNDIFVGSGPALDQLKTALAAEGRAKYTLPPPILPPRAGNAPAAP